jgi:hypothetical protein
MVEARASLCDPLPSEGVDAKLGMINRFTTIAEKEEPFQKQAST